MLSWNCRWIYIFFELCVYGVFLRLGGNVTVGYEMSHCFLCCLLEVELWIIEMFSLDWSNLVVGSLCEFFVFCEYVCCFFS